MSNKKFVTQAVEHCIDELAVCQQNIAAMYEINRRMSDKSRQYHIDYDKDVLRAAGDAYWSVLHQQLTTAWSNLAMFAPISEKAMEMLRKRTETWFDRPDTEIMGFLGNFGSYYTYDKDAFRAEVLAMFGIQRGEKTDGE